MTQAILDWAAKLNWKDWLIALGILAVFILLSKPITSFLLKFVGLLTRKTKTTLDDDIVVAFRKPIIYFLYLSGFYIALNYLGLPKAIDLIVLRLYRTGLLLCVGSGFYRLCDSTETFFGIFHRHLNIQFDRIVIPFLTKILKFIVGALVFTMIMADWGYSINGFVAGLGLAGLAVSLAAKDTASNFIGGFIIITETPFSIGEWIKTPSVEGIVEDISFRSTKIRTFADALVSVPNSTLANEAIINWSKMGKRQLSFEINLDLRTSKAQLETCLHEIREMLHNSEAIDNETIMVTLRDVKTTGFTIFFYCFTVTTEWAGWLAVREQVNLKLLDILENNHVKLSIPGRTIFYHDESPSNHIERAH